jgi:hypothetical protein
MRETLQWYAEQVSGCRKIGVAGDLARKNLDNDGGEKAREALNATADIDKRLVTCVSLHITPTDSYPDVDVEVHDGSYIQPGDSPVAMVTRLQAEGILAKWADKVSEQATVIEGLRNRLAAANKELERIQSDCLPEGHVIIEQADMMDAQGRVSQTVQVTDTGEEYERIVHAEEAYGKDAYAEEASHPSGGDRHGE